MYDFEIKTKVFVRIEAIRFPILEYKDGKIEIKELITKLEKAIKPYDE